MPYVSRLGSFGVTERADVSAADHDWTAFVITRQVFIACTTAGSVTLHWQGDAAGDNRAYVFAAGDMMTFVGACDKVIHDATSTFAGVIEGQW